MLPTIVVALLLSVVQAVSLVSTGSTLTFNGIPYYIPAHPVTTLKVSSRLLKSLPSAAGLVPLTVISTPSLSFTQADLDAAVAIFSVADDVFQSGFAEGTPFSFACVNSFAVFDLASMERDVYAVDLWSCLTTKRAPISIYLWADENADTRFQPCFFSTLVALSPDPRVRSNLGWGTRALLSLGPISGLALMEQQSFQLGHTLSHPTVQSFSHGVCTRTLQAPLHSL